MVDARAHVGAPGAGSFRMGSPPPPRVPQAPSPVGASASVDPGRRLLIIEDDVVTADQYALALRLAGYRVTTAYTARDGLEQAAHTNPDALIIDLRLPLMDGVALLEQLRSDPSLEHTPVLIVTGDYFVDDTTVERLQDLGADLRFKPIWLDDLVEIAKKLLPPYPSDS